MKFFELYATLTLNYSIYPQPFITCISWAKHYAEIADTKMNRIQTLPTGMETNNYNEMG